MTTLYTPHDLVFFMSWQMRPFEILRILGNFEGLNAFRAISPASIRFRCVLQARWMRALQVQTGRPKPVDIAMLANVQNPKVISYFFALWFRWTPLSTFS